MRTLSGRKVKLAGMSRPDWEKLRGATLGGSDAGVVMGLDKKCSVYELWGMKTGLHKKDNIPNQYTFFGHFFEEKVAELWQCYDPATPDFMNTVKNWEEGKVIRKALKYPFMVYHPLYDFAHANIDRLVPDQGDGKGQGILECKTISANASKQWEAGIPPTYYAQIMHYLWVTGLQWAEIAVLRNGNEFLVYHFERDEDFINELEEKAKEFWVRVLMTRKAIEVGADYSMFEPEPDHSENFKKYMSATILAKEVDVIQKGTIEQYNDCKKIVDYSQKKKIITKKIAETQSKLIFAMQDCTVLDFGAGGKATYRADKNGKKSLKINVK